MDRIGIFPGSFDPPTLGHLNIIQKAKNLCSHLIIAIAEKPTKYPLFSKEEKRSMLQKMTPDSEILFFHGLITDLAKEKKAHFLIRGLRACCDFEYESQMASANQKLSGLETVFLMTDEKYSRISSTLIREIAYFNGSIKDFVPKEIEPLIQKNS